MKNLKEKKGISLVVLILTIIVMIILATAIILSLNNSGIIGKANKTKRASDYASLKEYANVLKAEYELMSDAERTGYADGIAYVNAKLEAEGYKQRLNDDGILLMENTIDALEAGIKIGDVVTGYTLDEIEEGKRYPTSGKENTAPEGTEIEDITTTDTKQSIERIEYTTWKYIGIGENGEILIAPDMVESVTDTQNINLSGKGGFLNGPQELNDICKAMYSTSKGTARSMNIDDITRILDYTGYKGFYYSTSGGSAWTKSPKKISEIGTLRYISTPESGKAIGDYYSDYYYINGSSADILKLASESLKETLTKFVYTSNTYWLASSCVLTNFHRGNADFDVRYVEPGKVDAGVLFSSDGYYSSRSYVTRPVISLESNVQLTKVSDGNWSI